MTRAPFNLEAHPHLLDEGYDLIQMDEEHGDNGGPESGPMFWYVPPVDMYEAFGHRLFLDANGALAFQEAVQEADEEALSQWMYE